MTVFVEFDVKKPLGLEMNWLKACRNLENLCGRFWWYFSLVFLRDLTWAGESYIQKRTMSVYLTTSRKSFLVNHLASCYMSWIAETSSQDLSAKLILLTTLANWATTPSIFGQRNFFNKETSIRIGRETALYTCFLFKSHVARWRICIIYSQHL